MGFSRWLVLSGLAVAAILAVGPHAGGPVGAPETAVPEWAHVAPEQIAEARKYGVPVAFENGIGMRFVLIPAGTFLMGSPESEDSRDETESLHAVTLTRPYYLQTTEVTNRQYRRFRPDHDSHDFWGRSLDGDDQPVVHVSWSDAVAFGRWLDGREPDRTYRLPTEAEWERACRAGTSTPFWWGTSISPEWANHCAGDFISEHPADPYFRVAAHGLSRAPRPVPPGSRQPGSGAFRHRGLSARAASRGPRVFRVASSRRAPGPGGAGGRGLGPG